jgi:hypothetical protein
VGLAQRRAPKRASPDVDTGRDCQEINSPVLSIPRPLPGESTVTDELVRASRATARSAPRYEFDQTPIRT